jgi:excisionase family DNA binding protein
MESDRSHVHPVDRLTVPEAADLLGVSQSAVRKRIQRGTIPWDKDNEGRIYVYVDFTESGLGTEDDKSRDKSSGQSREELLEVYREQVEFLRRELERKDTIIMSLAQRIPKLEAAPEPREANEKISKASGKDEVPPESERRRSWLYRFFFGP